MAENNPSIIQQQWLVSVYLIVPLLALLVAVDIFLLNQTLQPYLTTALLSFPLYILFFELPHIVASLTSFADREYIAYYRPYLFRILPVVLIGSGLMFYVSLTAGSVFYALYTMYHFVRQQTGIALTMTRRRDWLHEVWTYAGIFAASLGFIIVFAPNFIPTYMGFVPLLAILLVPASIVFIGVSIAIAVRANNTRARVYIVGVSASIIASYVFLLLNYLFLVIFVARFIHDVTAFIFYIAHDRARNEAVQHNFIYRFLGTFGVPVLVATPLLAIVAGYVLRSELMVFQVGVIVIMLIGITHYYLEGIMWKRESIHRQQLRFE